MTIGVNDNGENLNDKMSSPDKKKTSKQRENQINY